MCLESIGLFCASVGPEGVMSSALVIVEFYKENKVTAQSPFVIFY